MNSADSRVASPYVSADHEWTKEYAPGYLFEGDFEHVPRFEMFLVDLRRDVNLATVRPVRHGGFNMADRAYQQQLFLIVGAITVASGQAETEMKRIVLADDPDKARPFSDADWTWAGLMKSLEVIAAKPDAAPELRQLLDWAKESGVEEIRNGAVHGYWWIYDTGHVHQARIRRDEKHQMRMGSWEEYQEQVEMMFEFAGRLQVLSVSWPTVVLPALDDPGAAQRRPWWPTPRNIAFQRVLPAD